MYPILKLPCPEMRVLGIFPKPASFCAPFQIRHIFLHFQREKLNIINQSDEIAAAAEGE